MANILRRLKIGEVSSVDVGAGEGCRIMLMKRHGDIIDNSMEALAESVASIITDNKANRGNKAAAMAKTFEQFGDHLKSNFKIAKAAIPPREEEPGDAGNPRIDDDSGKVAAKLKEFAAAMIMADPSFTEETAIHHLLHSAHGRKLAEHLNAISKSRKEEPMNRQAELRDIAKADGGMAVITKNIIDRGSTTISEHEFSAALMTHCKNDVRAFSKMLQTDVDIKRAYGICKGYPNTMSLEPVSTEVGNTNVEDDTAKAIAQLNELAEKQRALAPTLSTAQLFARVFADPANAQLAARAHRRPTASSTSGSELQRR
jgi:hypothetical protein